MGTIKIDNGQTIDNGDSGMTELEGLNRQFGLRDESRMDVILDAFHMARLAIEAGRDPEEAIRWSKLRNWMRDGADEFKVAAAVLEYGRITGSIP